VPIDEKPAENPCGAARPTRSQFWRAPAGWQASAMTSWRERSPGLWRNDLSRGGLPDFRGLFESNANLKSTG